MDYARLYSIRSPQNHHCHHLHFLDSQVSFYPQHFTASCIQCLSPALLTSRMGSAVNNPKNLKINPLLPKMIHRLMKSHMRCLQTYQLLYKLLFLLLLLLDVGHQFSLSYKSLLQSLHQHKVSVKMILQYLQC